MMLGVWACWFVNGNNRAVCVSIEGASRSETKNESKAKQSKTQQKTNKSETRARARVLRVLRVFLSRSRTFPSFFLPHESHHHIHHTDTPPLFSVRGGGRRVACECGTIEPIRTCISQGAHGPYTPSHNPLEKNYNSNFVPHRRSEGRWGRKHQTQGDDTPPPRKGRGGQSVRPTPDRTTPNTTLRPAAAARRAGCWAPLPPPARGYKY